MKNYIIKATFSVLRMLQKYLCIIHDHLHEDIKLRKGNHLYLI